MSDTSRSGKKLTAIGKRREQLGIKQSEVAHKVGVTEATINNWEKKQPDWLEHIVRLAVTLDCALHDLMEPGIITKRRSQKGLTRRDLARTIGVRENTLSKWESERPTHLEKLLRLCLALQCTSCPTILVENKDFFDKENGGIQAPLKGADLLSEVKRAFRKEIQQNVK